MTETSVTVRRLRVLEALALLLAYAAAIRMLPLRLLLSRTEAPAQPEATDPARAAAIRVRNAVRSARARLPFKPTCLVESLAAASMLRRRGQAHAMHIGALVDPDFQAHAWVEAAGVVVAGEGETSRYTVLLKR